MIRVRFIFSVILLGGIALSSIYYFYPLATNSKLAKSNHQPLQNKKELGNLSNTNIQLKSAHTEDHFNCHSALKSDLALIKSNGLHSLRSCIQDILRHESPDITALNSLILLWVDIDLTGALGFAESLNEKYRPYTLPEAIQRAAMIDSHRTKEWLIREGLFNIFDLKQAYYRGIAQYDPKWALNDILTLSNTHIDKQEQITLLNSVFEQWAKINAKEVIKWLNEKQIDDVELADNIKRFKVNVMLQLIRQDDLTAEKMILALDEGSDKTLLLRNLTKYLSNLDNELAVDWAESLTDPANRKIAMTAALKYWANSGAATEKIIQKALEESHNETRHAIIDDIALELANQNSQKLAELYAEFPQEEHPHIVEKIVGAWKSNSHEELIDWVQNLPMGSSKDAAIYAITTKAVHNFDQPEQALDMTREIDEYAVQFHARKTILKTIARRDLDKAHEMLVEMRLPAEEMRSFARAFTEQR